MAPPAGIKFPAEYATAGWEPTEDRSGMLKNADPPLAKLLN
jgi:hypothetical protein